MYKARCQGEGCAGRVQSQEWASQGGKRGGCINRV